MINFAVMAGLGPAIHEGDRAAVTGVRERRDVDGRVEPGHDEAGAC